MRAYVGSVLYQFYLCAILSAEHLTFAFIQARLPLSEILDCLWRQYKHYVNNTVTDDGDGWWREVFQNFRLVCTTWKYAHDQLTKDLTLSYELRPTTEFMRAQYRYQLDEFRQPSLEDMTAFMTRFPSLRFLTVIDPCLPELINLTRDDDVVERMWSDLLHTLPSLDGLSIRNLGGRKCRDSNYLTVLTGLTALTKLILVGECYFSNLRPLASLTTLMKLDLRGAHDIVTDDQLRSLADLTNLTELDLEGCDKLSTIGFATLCFFTDLESLDLTGTRVKKDVVLSIAHKLTSLTDLFVSTRLTYADQLVEDEPKQWEADCDELRLMRQRQLIQRPDYDVFRV